MITDSIGDYLTRIRNAIRAHHQVVEVPASNTKKRITEILHEKGYIRGFKFVDTPNNQGAIKIALKYNKNDLSVIKNIKRVSTPGRRRFVGVDELPRVLNGLGIAVLSTSRGVMTDKEARAQNIGGEVICYIY
jgi:small subunit ribosomal protein S8